MASLHGRLSIALFYAAALFLSSLVYAQDKPGSPVITVYKTPT
jgi:hypothetical protein